jgi:hypothetical protein
MTVIRDGLEVYAFLVRAVQGHRPPGTFERHERLGALDTLRTHPAARRTLQVARATPDRVESDAILEAGIRPALRLADGDA